MRTATVVKPCSGAVGSPRPKLLKDKLLRRGGGNLIYRVTVRNSGTASARKGRRLVRSRQEVLPPGRPA